MRLPLLDAIIRSRRPLSAFSNIFSLWSRHLGEDGEDLGDLLKSIYALSMFCLCNSMMICTPIAHNLRSIRV